MTGSPASFGLDTSVVLRLLTGSPEGQAAEAAAFLDSLGAKGQRAAVSDLVFSEAYFALQHHYGVPKAEALAALRQLAESDEILCTGAAGAVLQTPALAGAKPGFVDRLIHAGYSSGTGRTITFEKSAAKLPGSRLLEG